MSVQTLRAPFRRLPALGLLCCRIALAVGLGLGARHADSAPLTLDDALRLAQERSRQLPAQASSAAAAREMAVAAGQRPDPTLKAGITNLPINGPDRLSLTRDFMTMRSIGVMQEFTREGKLKARTARFEREAEVAEAGRELALANLQRDTAMAWLDCHYQERMRDVLVSQRDEAKLQIDAADAAYRGGKGSQADVFA
ncbi:MAG: TolC family protein, partial [Burkholderiales bacterium]